MSELPVRHEPGLFRRPGLIPLALALALGLASLAEARQIQPVKWQIGSSPSFSTGRYGTDSVTRIFYTPLTIRRLFRDGDVSVVVPLTCVHGNGTVTAGTGTGGQTQATAGPVTTACGRGDIVARGRYYVVDEHGAVPTVALIGHLKMPTASASLGLGTGKPDEGVGVEVSRSIARGLLAMVDTGYTFIGTPTGDDLNDVWWYDVGLSKRVGARANVSVFFEEYAALVPGLASARDVLAVLGLIRPGGWRMQLVWQVGLSDGAPDHGFTVGASRRF